VRALDRILILHADHVYCFDYLPMLAEHRRAAADVTIGVQRIERRFVRLFGMVEVDHEHRVRRLVEKPAEPTSDLIFTAFCLFRADVLTKVLAVLAEQPDEQWQHDISRDVLPFMISEGFHVQAFPVSGYWADIGTVERYLLGHLDLIRSPGALPLRDIPRTLPEARPDNRPRSLPECRSGGRDEHRLYLRARVSRQAEGQSFDSFAEGSAAEAREVEREGGHRDAEGRSFPASVAQAPPQG